MQRFRLLIEGLLPSWRGAGISARDPSRNSPSLCSNSQSFPALHTGLGGAAADPSRPHACALLVERADALMDCSQGSPEEVELATLTDAIEARPLRVLGNEQGKVYAHTEHPRRPSNMQAVCTAAQSNNGRTSEIVRNPIGRFASLWIGPVSEMVRRLP